MKKHILALIPAALFLLLPACDGDSSGSAPTSPGEQVIPLPTDFDEVTEPAPPSNPAPGQADVVEAQVEQDIFILINQARSQRGLQPLSSDSRLTALEARHNRNMALAGRNGTANLGISHNGFNSRAQAAFSLGFSTVGENVGAIGNTSNPRLAETFVRNWINSPVHLQNIVADVNTTGISVYLDPATGIVYASQIFAG